MTWPRGVVLDSSDVIHLDDHSGDGRCGRLIWRTRAEGWWRADVLPIYCEDRGDLQEPTWVGWDRDEETFVEVAGLRLCARCRGRAVELADQYQRILDATP